MDASEATDGPLEKLDSPDPGADADAAASSESEASHRSEMPPLRAARRSIRIALFSLDAAARRRESPPPPASAAPASSSPAMAPYGCPMASATRAVMA